MTDSLFSIRELLVHSRRQLIGAVDIWLKTERDLVETWQVFLHTDMHAIQAPRYLADHVIPAIEVASQHLLRSSNRHWLIVPRCRLNTYGRRAFPVAGPTVWNSLPDELRDPACDVDT